MSVGTEVGTVISCKYGTYVGTEIIEEVGTEDGTNGDGIRTAVVDFNK